MIQYPGGYTRVSRHVRWMQEVGAVLTTSANGQNVFHAVVATPKPLVPTGSSIESVPAESPYDAPEPTPADDFPRSMEPDFDAPSCCPAHATVELEDETAKSMKKLAIGNRI